MDGNSREKKYKKQTERETVGEMERQVKEGKALATRTAAEYFVFTYENHQTNQNEFHLERAAVISEGLYCLGEWNEGSKLSQVIQLGL